MLAELYIRNFAIIDELRINFSPGFNVLTGETGAGKSIILDAMALVLGDRADTTMIRDGCEEAYVEAIFQLDPPMQAAMAQLLDPEGLEADEPHLLLLARDIRVNGRNICRVNGRVANLALSRSIGERLVDIHGQGDHLSLLKPRSHLPLLDAYANLEGQRQSFKQQVDKLQAVRRELRNLQQDERALAQREDMLKFQLAEIQAANLTVGEEETLRAERKRLANVEQLAQLSNESLRSMTGIGEDELTASDLLGQAERSLTQMAKLDDTLAPLLESIQGLSFQLSDVSAELAAYQQRLDLDPGRLDFVDERLELVQQLKRKYGSDIAAILAWRDAAAQELEGISRSEERVRELLALEEQQLRRIGQLASELSAERRTAAAKLSSAVEQELTLLYMEGARFQVSATVREDENGAYVGDQRLAFDDTGIDQVEFLIAANPGESLKPLAKVASGGETSRLMLALKTALTAVDATPTLIFDEIDQGIGGRVGDVVGRKLWGLTTAARHQVIVVTHLPQLAGYGDQHFHVSKHIVEGRTTTEVTDLDSSGRVQELAAMLGTRGEHATGGAQSILEQVASVKAPG